MDGEKIPSVSRVRSYLLKKQDEICRGLEAEDGEARFQCLELDGERGGLARPRCLEDGPVLEKAAVNFSHTRGESLPKAATETRPELAGRSFQAVSLSLITHPRNPFAPTSHMNVRFFVASREDKDPIWWFGGGFDLTPYYGFEDDARHWHETARTACSPFGDDVYPRFKKWCDDYFVIKHRKEARGVGGLFFDDLNEGGFERCFQFLQSIADHYLPAYLPLLSRRKNHPYSDAHRQFQLYRRGRYVEFNLVYDRGTLYGLQAGGRIESILASMPPLVRWIYDWSPVAGSEEERLSKDFLRPRDWLTIDDNVDVNREKP